MLLFYFFLLFFNFKSNIFLKKLPHLPLTWGGGSYDTMMKNNRPSNIDGSDKVKKIIGLLVVILVIGFYITFLRFKEVGFIEMDGYLLTNNQITTNLGTFQK